MATHLKYNKNTLIGAVGPSVWAKLGPEDWFSHYVIVAANSRDFHAGYVVDLNLEQGELDEFTTQKIVFTPEFIKVAMEKLPEYKFLVYRPLDLPEGLDKSRFVANDMYFRKYEDKKQFREMFTDKLRIPEFEMVGMDDFLARSVDTAYADMSGRFGPVFVVQDNVGGGGRGTFIIGTVDELRTAMGLLAEKHLGTHVVISRFIRGQELSIQTFVSSRYLVKGPLQQQLVRNPELLDVNGRGGMYFCGGKFVGDVSEAVRASINRSIEVIADELRKDGYSGIFGVDFLVADSEAYVLEINARTTGVLPLLNEQDTPLPLHLLHILELANEEYEIEGDTDTAYDALSGPKSFVTLFNTTGHYARLDDSITTGNYVFDGSRLQKTSDSPRWQSGSEVMIQLFASQNFPAKPNLKLCNIFLRGDGFDADGRLTDEARRVVAEIKTHIVTDVFTN